MSTKVVTVLMKRLLEIDAVCNPDRQLDMGVGENADLDKFTRAKRELASFIREIKEDLNNREAARGTDTAAEMAKRSYEIREKIKRAEEMGDELEQIHKKKNNKLTMPGKDQEERKRQADSRKAVIELMHQHLRQIKLQQAKTGREVNDEVSSIEEADFNEGDQVLMQMDLRAMDDPDFDTVKKKKEAQIEEGLKDVHEGVLRLKQLAMQVGDILEEQGEELDRLNDLAGEVNEELKSANHLLSKVVKDVKSPAMFCCDCILCLMVIGIAIGLYFALTD